VPEREALRPQAEKSHRQPDPGPIRPEDLTQAERIWNQLWDVLYASTRHHQVYVYRLDTGGQPKGSQLWRGPAWPELPELPEILRDVFRGGEFRILIRKKRQMVFAGSFSVERPRDGRVTLFSSPPPGYPAARGNRPGRPRDGRPAPPCLPSIHPPTNDTAAGVT